MKKVTCSQWVKKTAVSFCLILLSINLPVKAASKQKENLNSENQIVFLDNFEPPGDGKPKDTGVGGSRDGLSCAAGEQPIRALMPQSNYGLTFQEQPAIYLYLPQTSAKQVVLAFQDEAGTDYIRAFLPIETSGIASFSLPQDEMPLEAGKNYQWKISVICGEHLLPGDPTFTGWVQRVEADTEEQLANTTASEQIRWYGEHGYWYDMLDAITRNPASEDNWQEVLEYMNRSKRE